MGRPMQNRCKDVADEVLVSCCLAESWSKMKLECGW